MVPLLLAFGGDSCSYDSAVSNLRIIARDCLGRKHTCPSGQCQGEHLRNDMVSLKDEGTYIFTDTETCVNPPNTPFL
jgi:hypothetical protein